MAKSTLDVDLLVACHDARRREKRERRKLADALVDGLMREAQLRALIREAAGPVRLAGGRPEWWIERARAAGANV